jgi:class 3 adenylate cyclase/predicted ATPase
MEIREWLRKLGLEQYEQAFHENAIDDHVLKTLTVEDLKDLGVALVGHRRRLLDAIAALRDDAAAVSLPSTKEPTPAGSVGVERRHLTVMFCDLVGSTVLSNSLDPEDLREIIGRYHDCVTQAVARFDGFVARYMGDGVLAYFGYPQAHEDNAERAVRAGLAMLGAIEDIEAPGQLQARVGIATGLVVVGDLLAEGQTRDRDVVGATPNLAARLQALAEPGTVVIADTTRAEVGALFDVQDLGLHDLRGFAERQRVWRILGDSGLHSRFDALRSGDVPLVGREQELAALHGLWTTAKAGEGRVVLLSGEPGIGKSRLSAAFSEQLRSAPHGYVQYFCSPHHRDSALFPFVSELERAAGYAREDALDARLDALESLAGAPQGSEAGDVALFADLLSLQGSPRYPPLMLPPQRKKQRTFEALLRRLGTLAQRQPLLIVFEDLHWIDPTSLELLNLIVARIAQWPALLVLSFRPEFQPPWTDQAAVSALSLDRLSPQDAMALVGTLRGNQTALPGDVVDDIVERCNGVPLFLEELTKAVLDETGGPERARALVSAVPGAMPAVPPTLQASLIARLDRLGSVAAEVAQIGAAIGAEFSFALLAAIASRDESELRRALGRLIEAGLVLERGASPQTVLSFKHALLQDAAYATLLREPRRRLHGRVADALLSAAGGTSGTAPEIIAHHLQNADRPREALGYWRQAGEQAVRRAANREAVAHFRRALSLVEAQPETPERWQAELAILSGLCPALMNVHGWSAPEIGQTVERAGEVGLRLNSHAALAPIIAGLWLFNIGRGRYDKGDENSHHLFRIARDLDDQEILLQAHHSAWPIRFFRGQWVEADEHVKAGLALYDEERHAHHRAVYLGHDPAICGLTMDASAQWALGYSTRADRLLDEAMVLARRLRHPPSLVIALWFQIASRITWGEPAAVIEMAPELLSLSDEHGLPHARAIAQMQLGWALAHTGDTAEGMARLEEGLGLYTRIGFRQALTWCLCLMSESLMAVGRYTEGLEQIGRAFDVSQEMGEQYYAPRLYTVRSALLLHTQGRDSEAAEASLRQGLEVARRQGARGWELQVATELGRLWLDRGRRDAARHLLGPIYAWFTEGFDKPDLLKARALLDELI